MRRLAVAVALCATIVGCNQSHDTVGLSPTDANVAGTFSLVLANGQPLPLLVSLTSSEERDLVGDQFVIDAAGTWNETTSFKITDLQSGAERDTAGTTLGTYTIANGQINFVITTTPTGTFTGSVTGSTLIVLYSGSRFAYSR